MLTFLATDSSANQISSISDRQASIVALSLNKLLNEHLLKNAKSSLTSEIIQQLVLSETSLLILVVKSQDKNNDWNTFEFVSSESSSFILGCGVTVIFSALSGIRARIEDIVLHPSSRGLGLGERLVSLLIKFAQEHGCNDIQLTSNYDRKAAIALYQKMGFTVKDTGCYVLNLK